MAFGLENMGLSGGHRTGGSPRSRIFLASSTGSTAPSLNSPGETDFEPCLLAHFESFAHHLDEPTARLDPVAVRVFITFGKIHQEIGTTILLSEHRMADVLPLVNQVLYLEEGHLLYDGEPRAFASFS